MKNRLLKSVALTLILCLVFQQFSYASPEELKHAWEPVSRFLAQKEHREHRVWAQQFLPPIPESVATIEDAWRSSSAASVVVLIQDAHTNNSGQLNEAKLLNLLYTHKKELSEYLFLEAGHGNESLSFLRKRATAEKRQQVAKSFLLQAKLQGVEYLDLTSDHRFTLWGVEDMALYAKSVDLYRESARQREKFSDYLDRVDNTIETLKPKVLNPYLLAFDRKVRDHRKGRLSSQEYLSLLFRESQKLGLKGFENLNLLEELKRKEKEINFEEAQKEQTVFISSLPAQDQKELLEAARSKEDQVRKAFSVLLSEKLKNNEAFPNLQKYLAYLQYAGALNPQEILREQKVLEEKVLESLILTPDEKELTQASDGVDTIKKLFLLQFTPGDYEDYKKNKSRLDIQTITGFLNRRLMRQKDHYDKALFLENGYEDMARYCEEFYELTYERDKKFIENMSSLTGRGEAASILITGGYHTPNLKYLLRQKNISYISLTPQVLQETNLKRYEEILLNQKISPSLMVSSPVLNKAITPLRTQAAGRLAELSEALEVTLDQSLTGALSDWDADGRSGGRQMHEEGGISAARLAKSKKNGMDDQGGLTDIKLGAQLTIDNFFKEGYGISFEPYGNPEDRRMEIVVYREDGTRVGGLYLAKGSDGSTMTADSNYFLDDYDSHDALIFLSYIFFVGTGNNLKIENVENRFANSVSLIQSFSQSRQIEPKTGHWSGNATLSGVDAGMLGEWVKQNQSNLRRNLIEYGQSKTVLALPTPSTEHTFKSSDALFRRNAGMILSLIEKPSVGGRDARLVIKTIQRDVDSESGKEIIESLFKYVYEGLYLESLLSQYFTMDRVMTALALYLLDRKEMFGANVSEEEIEDIEFLISRINEKQQAIKSSPDEVNHKTRKLFGTVPLSTASLFGQSLKQFIKGNVEFKKYSFALPHIFGDDFSNMSSRTRSIAIRSVALSAFLYGPHLDKVMMDYATDFYILENNLRFLFEHYEDPAKKQMISGDDLTAIEVSLLRVSVMLTRIFDTRPDPDDDERLTVNSTEEDNEDTVLTRLKQFLDTKSELVLKLSDKYWPAGNEGDPFDPIMVGFVEYLYRNGRSGALELFNEKSATLGLPTDVFFLNPNRRNENPFPKLVPPSGRVSYVAKIIKTRVLRLKRYFKNVIAARLSSANKTKVEQLSAARLAQIDKGSIKYGLVSVGPKKIGTSESKWGLARSINKQLNDHPEIRVIALNLNDNTMPWIDLSNEDPNEVDPKAGDKIAGIIAEEYGSKIGTQWEVVEIEYQKDDSEKGKFTWEKAIGIRAIAPTTINNGSTEVENILRRYWNDGSLAFKPEFSAYEFFVDAKSTILKFHQLGTDLNSLKTPLSLSIGNDFLEQAGMIVHRYFLKPDLVLKALIDLARESMQNRLLKKSDFRDYFEAFKQLREFMRGPGARLASSQEVTEHHWMYYASVILPIVPLVGMLDYPALAGDWRGASQWGGMLLAGFLVWGIAKIIGRGLRRGTGDQSMGKALSVLKTNVVKVTKLVRNGKAPNPWVPTAYQSLYPFLSQLRWLETTIVEAQEAIAKKDDALTLETLRDVWSLFQYLDSQMSLSGSSFRLSSLENALDSWAKTKGHQQQFGVYLVLANYHTQQANALLNQSEIEKAIDELKDFLSFSSEIDGYAKQSFKAGKDAPGKVVEQLPKWNKANEDLASFLLTHPGAFPFLKPGPNGHLGKAKAYFQKLQSPAREYAVAKGARLADSDHAKRVAILEPDMKAYWEINKAFKEYLGKLKALRSADPQGLGKSNWLSTLIHGFAHRIMSISNWMEAAMVREVLNSIEPSNISAHQLVVWHQDIRFTTELLNAIAHSLTLSLSGSQWQKDPQIIQLRKKNHAELIWFWESLSGFLSQDLNPNDLPVLDHISESASDLHQKFDHWLQQTAIHLIQEAHFQGLDHSPHIFDMIRDLGIGHDSRVLIVGGGSQVKLPGVMDFMGANVESVDPSDDLLTAKTLMEDFSRVMLRVLGANWLGGTQHFQQSTLELADLPENQYSHIFLPNVMYVLGGPNKKLEFARHVIGAANHNAAILLSDHGDDAGTMEPQRKALRDAASYMGYVLIKTGKIHKAESALGLVDVFHEFRILKRSLPALSLKAGARLSVSSQANELFGQSPDLDLILRNYFKFMEDHPKSGEARIFIEADGGNSAKKDFYRILLGSERISSETVSLIKNLGGLAIAVGVEPGLELAHHAGADRLVFVDNDLLISQVILPLRLLLFAENPTRVDYLEKVLLERFTPLEKSIRYDKSVNEIINLSIASAQEGLLQENLTVYVDRYFELLKPHVAGEIQDFRIKQAIASYLLSFRVAYGDPTVRSLDKASYLPVLSSPVLIREHQDILNGTLNQPDAYDKMRRMALEGGIQGLSGDMGGETLLRLFDQLNAKNETVSLIYIDRLLPYMADFLPYRTDQPRRYLAFMETLKKIPVRADGKSVVVYTVKDENGDPVARATPHSQFMKWAGESLSEMASTPDENTGEYYAGIHANFMSVAHLLNERTSMDSRIELISEVFKNWSKGDSEDTQKSIKAYLSVLNSDEGRLPMATSEFWGDFNARSYIELSSFEKKLFSQMLEMSGLLAPLGVWSMEYFSKSISENWHADGRRELENEVRTTLYQPSFHKVLRRVLVDDQKIHRNVNRVMEEGFRYVPRHLFMDPDLANKAYKDSARFIGNGQTISTPSLMALILSVLELEGHEKVLELGAGSGWFAAWIGRLTRGVTALERIPRLARIARYNSENLAKAQNHPNNVEVIQGDGVKFANASSDLYDVIVVSAMAEKLPEGLLERLAPGGKMIIPINNKLYYYRKDSNGNPLDPIELLDVKYVPLIEDPVSAPSAARLTSESADPPSPSLSGFFGDRAITRVLDYQTGKGDWMRAAAEQPWLSDGAQIVGYDKEIPFAYDVLPESAVDTNGDWQGLHVIHDLDNLQGQVDLAHVSYMALSERMLVSSGIPENVLFLTDLFRGLEEINKNLKEGGWLIFSHADSLIDRTFVKMWLEKNNYQFQIFDDTPQNFPDYPRSMWNHLIENDPVENGQYIFVARKPVFDPTFEQFPWPLMKENAHGARLAKWRPVTESGRTIHAPHSMTASVLEYVAGVYRVTGFTFVGKKGNDITVFLKGRNAAFGETDGPNPAGEVAVQFVTREGPGSDTPIVGKFTAIFDRGGHFIRYEKGNSNLLANFSSQLRAKRGARLAGTDLLKEGDSSGKLLTHFDESLVSLALGEFGAYEPDSSQGLSLARPFRLSENGLKILEECLDENVTIQPDAQVLTFAHEGKRWPVGIVFSHGSHTSYFDFSDIYADPFRHWSELEWQFNRDHNHPALSEEIINYISGKSDSLYSAFALLLTSNINPIFNISQRNSPDDTLVEPYQLFNIYEMAPQARGGSVQGRLIQPTIKNVYFDPSDAHSRDWQDLLIKLKMKKPDIFSAKRTIILGVGAGPDLFYVPQAVAATDQYAGSIFLARVNFAFGKISGQIPLSDDGPVPLIQTDRLPEGVDFDLGLMNTPGIDLDNMFTEHGVGTYWSAYSIAFDKFSILFADIKKHLLFKSGSSFILRLSFGRQSVGAEPNGIFEFIAAHPELEFKDLGNDFYEVSKSIVPPTGKRLEHLRQGARLADISPKQLTISIRDMNILKIRGAKDHQRPEFVYQLLDDSTAMPLLAEMDASSAALTIPHHLYKIIIPPSPYGDGITPTGPEPPSDETSNNIQIIYMRTRHQGYISTGLYYKGRFFNDLEELKNFSKEWVLEKYGSLQADPTQPYIYYVPRLVWWRTVNASDGMMAVRNDDKEDKDYFPVWDKAQLLKKASSPKTAGVVIRVKKRIPERYPSKYPEIQPDYFSPVEVYSDGQWISYGRFIQSREAFAKRLHIPKEFDVVGWLRKFLDVARAGGKDYVKLVFFLGMLWRNMTEWWGDYILRSTPHEGDDIAKAFDSFGKAVNIEVGDKIPSPGYGEIEAVVPDYMGDTLFIKLQSRDRQPLYADDGRKYLWYLVIMHVRTSLEKGDLINPDGIIATMADPHDKDSPASPHAHVNYLAVLEGYDFEKYGLDAINPSNHRGDVFRIGIFEGVNPCDLNEVAIFEREQVDQNANHPTRNSFLPMGSAARLASENPSAGFLEYLRVRNDDRQYVPVLEEGHIRSSREFILRGAEGLRGKAVLLGLGNAHEYTIEGLAQLYDQFDELVIAELDQKAIDKTLDRLDAYLRTKGASLNRNKIQIRAEDVSGIMGAATTHMDSMMAKKLSIEDTKTQILKILTEAAEKDPPRPLESHEASYVVSSLLATQPANLLSDYIASLFHGRFDDAATTELMLSEPYKKAKAALDASTHQKHIRLLKEWVHSQGKIYFSDTVKETNYRYHPQMHPMLQRASPILSVFSQTGYDELSRNFESVVSEEWIYFWDKDLIDLGVGSAFFVQAFLLAPLAARLATPEILATHITGVDNAQLILKHGFYGEVNGQVGNLEVEPYSRSAPAWIRQLSRLGIKSALVAFTIPEDFLVVDPYFQPARHMMLSPKVRVVESVLPEAFVNDFSSSSARGPHVERLLDRLKQLALDGTLGHIPVEYLNINETIKLNSQFFPEVKDLFELFQTRNEPQAARLSSAISERAKKMEQIRRTLPDAYQAGGSITDTRAYYWRALVLRTMGYARQQQQVQELHHLELVDLISMKNSDKTEKIQPFIERAIQNLLKQGLLKRQGENYYELTDKSIQLLRDTDVNDIEGLWVTLGYSPRKKVNRSIDFTTDEAVEFLGRVFWKQHRKTGRIMIGSSQFRLHFNEKTDELVIFGFRRKLLQTKDIQKKDWKVSVEPGNETIEEVGLSLVDFKTMLQSSFDAVKRIPSNAGLDKKKALVTINLEGLNPGSKEFDGVTLPHLIRELEYARKQPYGTEANYLLVGSATSLELATARLKEYFKGGQDYIFTVESDVPPEFKGHQSFMTDPENPQPGRNFYVESPGEGDILNLRAAIRFASDLARIKDLSTSDLDFMRFRKNLNPFLKSLIVNVEDFIAAIEMKSKNGKSYALPILAHVPTNAIVAAARLAGRMTEQSA